jgi:hypothetical protein
MPVKRIATIYDFELVHSLQFLGSHVAIDQSLMHVDVFFRLVKIGEQFHVR